MRRLALVLAAAAFAAGGCARPPALAGGEPVSHWVQALKDPDAKQRKKAAHKLGNAGPAEPDVVPALTAALQDRDAAVRGEAALALGKCGPAAKDAIPALTALRQDRDATVRSYAADALGKIQGGGSQ
jgi:HEAT repeat protein